MELLDRLEIDKLSKIKLLRGFSYLEIIITISIVLTLLGFVTLNLLNVRNRTSLNASLDLLVSDIENQQIKAISNNTEGRTSTDNYGIIIQNDRYILFHGTYSAGNSSNVTIQVESPLILSTTFPSSTVIFTKGTGEIASFVNGQNTITIRDTSQNVQRTLNVNALGVIVSED